MKNKATNHTFEVNLDNNDSSDSSEAASYDVRETNTIWNKALLIRFLFGQRI
jgi:hypothetical protein